MSELTLKEKLENCHEMIEIKDELIEEQEKMITIQKTSIKKCLDGWDRTLHSWKKWATIQFITSLIALVCGILGGINIGRIL